MSHYHYHIPHIEMVIPIPSEVAEDVLYNVAHMIERGHWQQILSSENDARILAECIRRILK